MGLDGVWTLLLSTLIVMATAGLSWLPCLWRSWRVAVDTPTQVQLNGWIVVLGRRLLGATVSYEFAERLRRAEALYRQAGQAHILVLGGHTSEGPFSEAEQGRRFLRQRGLPAAHLHIEDVSHHTLENLQNGRRLLGQDSRAPFVLVTSRYHLARSLTLAQGMRLQAVPCAAEDRWQWSAYNVWRLLIESLFVHWYWTGRIWSLLTFNRKSLARIS